MRRRKWRSGWLGKILNIHAPSAHAFDECWCIGTKREIVVPEGFATASKAMADMGAFYRFVSDALDPYCDDESCEYLEPHKHGSACDVACQICMENKHGIQARER